MHGRTYYLTTLDAWQRNSPRFASSHFAHADPSAGSSAVPGATIILAFVEADEGVHNALAADPEWEPLPHPLSNKPVSARVAAALAAHGVATNANTFDVAEAVSRAHPILRYRVF
ncbi:MAG: hypothetical protein WAK91_01875 [Candidatus Acidiferrales bacterium]|jgi:hypothetical protein